MSDMTKILRGHLARRHAARDFNLRRTTVANARWGGCQQCVVGVRLKEANFNACIPWLVLGEVLQAGVCRLFQRGEAACPCRLIETLDPGNGAVCFQFDK